MKKIASVVTPNAPSKDYDKIVQMRWLIWIFVGQHVQRYVFWRCGSYVVWKCYMHYTSFKAIIQLRLYCKICKQEKHLSQRTTKPTIRPVWPTQTQISIYIHPVWIRVLFLSQFGWPGGCNRHMRPAKALIRLPHFAFYSDCGHFLSQTADN